MLEEEVEEVERRPLEAREKMPLRRCRFEDAATGLVGRLGLLEVGSSSGVRSERRLLAAGRVDDADHAVVAPLSLRAVDAFDMDLDPGCHVVCRLRVFGVAVAVH